MQLTPNLYNVDVVLHSKYEDHPELITLALSYPRYIHAELMTHRVFSRNASSSRAIPTKTMLRNIKKNPAAPIYWGTNQAGMQAGKELTGWRLCAAKAVWKTATMSACFFSGMLHKIGLHKQHANRITEPYQYITTLVTSTEWDNFYKLRAHPDAQPEIKFLAELMIRATSESRPQLLKQGHWHLPYVDLSEFENHSFADLQKASAARCARVSYLNHDGSKPNVEKDIKLFNRLVGSQPIHASPLEHVAVPSWKENANLRGWKQLRRVVENQYN